MKIYNLNLKQNISQLKKIIIIDVAFYLDMLNTFKKNNFFFDFKDI